MNKILIALMVATLAGCGGGTADDAQTVEPTVHIQPIPVTKPILANLVSCQDVVSPLGDYKKVGTYSVNGTTRTYDFVTYCPVQIEVPA